MTTTLTYQNVRVNGAFTIRTLDGFHMESRLNSHARAYISGTVDEEINVLELEKQLKGGVMSVLAADDTSPLFCGIILDAMIIYKNNHYKVEVWLISGSYLLDIKKKSRSFQDIDMGYKDVVNQTLDDTNGAACIMTAGQDEKIKIPILQYQETDWEFCRRLASHFGVSLLPELSIGAPKFWFGMRNSSEDCEFEEDEYSVNISEAFYENGGESCGLKRRDFFYYKVQSYHNYQIGDKAVFKGKNLVICEKECYFERGIVVFLYTLALPSFLTMQRQYNEKICGMSILGTVLETAGETLKIHLDIDPAQAATTAYPYNWVPGTGNLMYLMPKVGTRVSLYFYNSDERSARAINCVRTNGGSQCVEMGDYENRYFTTEHDKRYYFFPTVMGLVGTSNTETPLHIQLDDEDGVTFQSHKALNIMAVENISVKAPIFIIKCMTELMATHAGLTLEGDGENIPYNVVAHPIATMDMAATLNTLQGEYTKYAGWKYTSYPPFNDAPKKGEFDWAIVGKVALGILAAVAVGVLVGVVVAATGGAALAALPVLASVGITASGIGIAAGAITAVAGVAAAVKLGIDEYESGNVRSVGEYLMASFEASMRTGAVVMSVVNTLGAIGPMMSIINGFGGLQIGLAQIAGTNMTQLVFTGGSITATDVSALAGHLGLAGASIMFANSFNGYTNHGSFRASGRNFSDDEINNVIQNYSHKVYQEGGKTVYAKKVGNWYEVVILNSEGKVVSTIGGQTHSLKTWAQVIKMLGNNGGFSTLPLP